MKNENSNRTRIIGLRLTPAEYAKIERKWKASTCRKLSNYVRRNLFDKPAINNPTSKMLVDLLRLLPNYSDENSFRMKKQLLKNRRKKQLRW